MCKWLPAEDLSLMSDSKNRFPPEVEDATKRAKRILWIGSILITASFVTRLAVAEGSQSIFAIA